jgi:hypothetical protein
MKHPLPIGTLVTFSVDGIFDIDGYIYDTVGAPTTEQPDREFAEHGWYFVMSDTNLYEVVPSLIRLRTQTDTTPMTTLQEIEDEEC